MQNVPDAVLEVFVVTEAAVAALVRDDPATGGNRPFDNSVQQPDGHGPQRDVRRRQEGAREQAQRQRQKRAEGAVRERDGRVLDVALGWDSTEDLLRRRSLQLQRADSLRAGFPGSGKAPAR